MIERHLQKPERIEVLHLGLGPELLGATQTHAHVRIAAQMAFFHIAGRNLDILEHLFQLGQVCVGLVRAAHIRLADDLDQRYPATIQVDIGVPVGVFETFVNALAGVVFQVHARHPEAFLHPRDVNIHVAALG